MLYHFECFYNCVVLILATLVEHFKHFDNLREPLYIRNKVNELKGRFVLHEPVTFNSYH